MLKHGVFKQKNIHPKGNTITFTSPLLASGLSMDFPFPIHTALAYKQHMISHSFRVSLFVVFMLLVRFRHGAIRSTCLFFLCFGLDSGMGIGPVLKHVVDFICELWVPTTKQLKLYVLGGKDKDTRHEDKDTKGNTRNGKASREGKNHTRESALILYNFNNDTGQLCLE
nr:hypothetical protein [Tanacetum cinerariifolium]